MQLAPGPIAPLTTQRCSWNVHFSWNVHQARGPDVTIHFFPFKMFACGKNAFPLGTTKSHWSCREGDVHLGRGHQILVPTPCLGDKWEACGWTHGIGRCLIHKTSPTLKTGSHRQAGRQAFIPVGEACGVGWAGVCDFVHETTGGHQALVTVGWLAGWMAGWVGGGWRMAMIHD